MKTCTKCGIEKDESEFCKDRKSKDGFSNQCKECKSRYDQQRYDIIKEKVRARAHRWYQEHKKESAIYSQRHYQENKEKISVYYKQWREEHKEEVAEKKKLDYQKNKERYIENGKQYRVENRTIISERKKKQRKKDIKRTAYLESLRYHRYVEKPQNRLRMIVSGSIRKALHNNNGGKKGGSILNFLPYSIQQLKEHLESQFDCYMSWENHGIYNSNRYTWQIDHIIPHSSFCYDSMEHPNFQKCWALENLRPLKSIDNLKKGNRIIEDG